MKLTGFELEIEGSREDVPNISRSLTQQLAGMLQPAGAIIDGQPSPGLSSAEEILPAIEVKPQSEAAPRKRGRTRPRRSVISNGTDDVDEGALDWRHDSSVYGSPLQSWNTAQKALWTLYVVGEATGQKELAAKRIALSFNKHFRQAKEILPHNVSRDLGKLKVKNPAVVSEDTRQSPSAWYLTDAGIKAAQILVAEALGQTE